MEDLETITNLFIVSDRENRSLKLFHNKINLTYTFYLIDVIYSIWIYENIAENCYVRIFLLLTSSISRNSVSFSQNIGWENYKCRIIVSVASCVVTFEALNCFWTKKCDQNFQIFHKIHRSVKLSIVGSIVFSTNNLKK